MNNALLIQQCLSVGGYTGAWSGIFCDMLRLTQQRHAAYARAWKFDYQLLYGDADGRMAGGAWDKVVLVKQALERGYPYVVWMDTDAAIMDFDTDLRTALPDGIGIGAVVHDPATSEFLRGCVDVKRHYNVGVLYVRNSERTLEFFTAWLKAHPGPARWMDQGAFNELIEDERFTGLVGQVPDRFNATVNVNMVDKPAVMGWHGVMPPERRLTEMRGALASDFIEFRV